MPTPPCDDSLSMSRSMIRFLITGAILIGMLPAAEASPKGQCKDRCGSMYRFCKTKATTKQARAFCKADRKSCKKSCR